MIREYLATMDGLDLQQLHLRVLKEFMNAILKLISVNLKKSWIMILDLGD